MAHVETRGIRASLFMETASQTLLAADVGGTKTNLAIYASVGSLKSPLAEASFPSGKYARLEDLIREFLEDSGETVDHACFGVAGPVIYGSSTVTNLPWMIEETRLGRELGLSSVHLINDLAAIATAIPSLGVDSLRVIQQGNSQPHASIAVVAPGTGLGEAFMTWEQGRYNAHASEGGHSAFAPGTERERGLLTYLSRQHHHVSVERIASGSGIPNIYEFIRDTDLAEEPDWLRRKIAEADDPTPVIIETALDEGTSCDICQETLDIFLSALGSEAANLALKVLATGGVYLGGGIPPRILPALQDGRFQKAFRNKGRFREMLTRIPIHVIMDPKAALTGAALHGFAMREQQCQQPKQHG
jgi:glucokinase